MSISPSTFWSLLVAVLLLLTAHRLPAPIQEVQESPTPAPTAKSKSRPVPKRKSGSEASESAANSVRRPAFLKQRRFPGTWSGTMPETSWGNLATELVVDQTETTMEWQESSKRKGLARAQLAGNTLQASFPAGIRTAKWSLTPEPDGATARVRLQAFMNDQITVFHRIGESSADQSAR